MENTKFNLQLFADGGAAGGDGGAAAAAAGDTGVKAPDAGVRSRKRENPLANVQYGIQPNRGAEQVAPANQEAAEQGEDTESFESLIKGKYKQDFDSHVQGIIQQRFKKNADNEAMLESYKPLMEAIGKKFNCDPTDIKGLMKAITRDPEMVSQMALERGVSEDTMNEILDLQERSQLLDEIEVKMRMRQHYDNLAQQVEAAKEYYPDFNFEAEMNDPRFARLTAPGVNVDPKTAYEVVHLKELMKMQAQQQAEMMAKAIQTNGARPTENGLRGNQTASTVKTDPSTLTREDLSEIRRRVMRGEKVVF